MLLFKKAIRSIWSNKKAYIACIVLLTLGIMLFVSMQTAAEKLKIAKDIYYEQYRLADVFGSAAAIPQSAEDRFRRVEGIADVGLRLVIDGRVLMPDSDKVITMRFVSVNLAEENPINGIKVIGEKLSQTNDVYVSQEFLTAHKLALNDSFKTVISGKEFTFRISAAASSPEYVYTVKDEKEILPDPETFSVAYMSLQNMQTMLNKQGVFNDCVFELENGYEYDDVKPELEDILDEYGYQSLYPVKDLISFVMLDQELEANKSMSVTITVAFVALAMIVLYLMLKRVIEMDRTQIGMLKAFGYSNAKIIFHYIFYGLSVGAAGGLFGAALGYRLSIALADIYNEFYKLPDINANVSAIYITVGLLIAVSGGVIGAFMGARGILALFPSEAMRPAAPMMLKSDPLRAVPLLRFILNSGGSMAVRSMIRSPMRSIVVIVGVMFSFGMLAFTGSYPEMIDSMMLNQFSKIQVYDANIKFENVAGTNEAIESVNKIGGVYLTEPLLEMPAIIKHENIQEGNAITGIPENSSLYKIYDDDLRGYQKPTKSGILLSSSFAKKINAKTGDVLLIDSPYLSEETQIIVAGVVTQNFGSGCYMELSGLQKMMNSNDVITSVMVKTRDIEHLKSELKDANNVAVVEDKVSTLNKYNSFLAPYNAIIYILIIVSIIVGFSIIYNTTTISLSERKREYATLRVLGMQIPMVARIIGFEYWFLSFIGICLGIPFTFLLKASLSSAMESDMFSFPTYTPAIAYYLGCAGCICAVWLSNRSTIKNIKDFDMVEVLKERE